MALRNSQPLYQQRGSKINTAPASEPVSAAELRTYAVADATLLPDADAEAYIATARQYIEDMTGIAMVTQTWDLSLDRWPSTREPWWDGVRQIAINEINGTPDVVSLPRYPLQSVSAVTTYDESGNSTAVTVADVFDVDSYGVPGRMVLKNSATWPVALRNSNAILITYVAGYGDAADVPKPLAQAVKQFAGYLFDHRGGCDMNDGYMKSGAAGLAAGYSVKSI